MSFRLPRIQPPLFGCSMSLSVSLVYRRKMMFDRFSGGTLDMQIMPAFWLLIAGEVGCGLDSFWAVSPISPMARFAHLTQPRTDLDRAASAIFNLTRMVLCGFPLRAASVG